MVITRENLRGCIVRQEKTLGFFHALNSITMNLKSQELAAESWKYIYFSAAIAMVLKENCKFWIQKDAV